MSAGDLPVQLPLAVQDPTQFTGGQGVLFTQVVVLFLVVPCVVVQSVPPLVAGEVTLNTSVSQPDPPPHCPEH